MGLDMYAMITTDHPDSDVDFRPTTQKELHYWRKHPNLHGLMETLYYDKGGKADSFNCVCVAICENDLNRLEAAIKSDDLPATSGFFFGETDGTERDDDLAFVAKARDAIKNGFTVYYDSWW